MYVFLSHDWSMTPLFSFFQCVHIRSFFRRPLRSGRGSRDGTDRVVRTDCAYVVRTGALFSMYLFGHVGFILHTGTFTYLSTLMSMCVCMYERVVLDDGSITPMGRPFAHRNGSGDEEKRTGRWGW